MLRSTSATLLDIKISRDRPDLDRGPHSRAARLPA
ncbi:hypothetical protein STVIR_0806 [Streptomyces viridochromogenes Tue57]|uniref:Uncharacterized protein n=1 Tax=Streptomyces viridochromogenes Tue57 TaxID=1160705 RepID=L8PP37_STRVR|nr:hypothetical protein STVIR_0806 [Streptomyces viridochromogenes Tue57]